MMRFVVFVFIISSCASPGDRVTPFDEVSHSPKILDSGNISTKDSHESINHVSDDLKTVYFTRSNQNFETSTLYTSSFSNGKWGEPKILPFSGTFYDAGMSYSPDRDRIFFTSKRDPKKSNLSTEWNIWEVSRKDKSGWLSPKVLLEPINSSKSECCLTMNKSGLAFFSSNRDGSWDIYMATYLNSTFTNIKKLDTTVNSLNGEWPSYTNDKGDSLLISSIRDSGFGGDDIYLVRKKNGKWSSPVLLDSTINTPSYEDSPLLIPSENLILYSSWKDNAHSSGLSNIYYSKFSGFK